MLARLGRGIAHHPLPVALTWLVLVVAGFGASVGVVGPGLFAQLTGGDPSVQGEAATGRELLADANPRGPSSTLVFEGLDLTDEAVPGVVGEARSGLLDLDGVADVVDPYALPAQPDGSPAPQSLALFSTDQDGFAVSVTLEPGLGDRSDEVLAQVESRLSALGDEIERLQPGSAYEIGGITQLIDEIIGQTEEDLRSGETVAVAISLLVMVFVFGGLLAAGLPIAGAIASIAGGFTVLLGFARLIDLDSTVVNVVTVMGLGLCIDYGLLLVSRFREELRRRPPLVTSASTSRRRRRAHRKEVVPDAVAATLQTAGRTVLFSGLIVATSLSGLIFFEAPILKSLGAAGISVVAVALLVALTLVPALLSLAGTRLAHQSPVLRLPGLARLARGFGEIAPDEGVFSRLARRVQRRPWFVTLGVSALLLVAASPVLHLQLRSAGAEMLPADSPQRVFSETIDREYPTLTTAPVQVVTMAAPDEIGSWATGLADVDGVTDVEPPRQVGDVTLVPVRVDDERGNGPVATGVVEAIRADRPSEQIWVTGQAAGQVDFGDSLAERAPWAIGLVVLATFVLLFAMTGSVLIPVKALLMNVISLGASLGVVVWGFQDAHLSGLLGFTPPDGIDTVIPPIVLALGFGLSMDYEVFLLSRVKEMRDGGLPTDQAVVAGLQRSGRIISSAALIVVIVFSGFILGELMIIQQTGVALAVAIALDATLVRMLLVPATMTLLGDWNWWAPRPLRRLHDRFGLSH